MINAEKKMTEITPKTLIFDLLNDYPELENKLIEIAPIFIKLKNPVLRRTIAKITSLRQAAAVGDVSISSLVNQLRTAAGQNSLSSMEENPSQIKSPLPEWINNKIQIIYDAREDIENGVHPLGKVMGEITSLNNSQVYRLVTSFLPAPLIDTVKNKGFQTWTTNDNNIFETYIAKL